MVLLAVIFFMPWLLTGISCSVFTNSGPATVKDDPTPKPVYLAGSTIDITWTSPGETNKGVSIILDQLNKTTGHFLDDMEYLTRTWSNLHISPSFSTFCHILTRFERAIEGTVGVTTYTWLVGTRKDLAISNMFYLGVFQEGKTNADANSRKFLIELQNGNGQLIPSSSSSSSSFSPSATSSNRTSTLNSGTVTNPAANDPTPSQPQSSTSSQGLRSQPSSSIPVSTTIGIAIGALGAMALSIGLILFLFRLRKKRIEGKSMAVTVAAPSDPRGYYRGPPGSYQFFGSIMSEAPSKMPMEHTEPIELREMSQGQAKQSTSLVRYEM